MNCKHCAVNKEDILEVEVIPMPDEVGNSNNRTSMVEDRVMGDTIRLIDISTDRAIKAVEAEMVIEGTPTGNSETATSTIGTRTTKGRNVLYDGRLQRKTTGSIS